MKEEVEDEHDNQNEGSPSSKARRFRSHLMVAGPIGRVAHKYHNDSENSSNFGKEVLKGEERGEKAGRGIVRSFFTGAEASRKKQDFFDPEKSVTGLRFRANILKYTQKIKDKTLEIVQQDATAGEGGEQVNHAKDSSVRTKRLPLCYGDILFLLSANDGTSSQQQEDPAKHKLPPLDILSTDSTICHRSCVLHLEDEMNLTSPRDCLYVVESPLYSVHHESSESHRTMVHQGDPILLRKWGEPLYLCRDPQQKKADVEKKRVRLSVSSETSQDAQFRIFAKYETSADRVIYYNDQTSIVHVSTGLNLHEAPTQCVYGDSGVDNYHLVKRVEVNLGSLHQGVSSGECGSFFWRFRRYAAGKDNCQGNDKASFQVGDCVRLANKFVSGFLWGSSNSDVFENGVISRDLELRQEEDAKVQQSGGSLDSSSNKQNEDKKSYMSFFFSSKAPEFCINDDEASTSPKSLFVIENASSLIGGDVTWDGFYRLKHVVSGCYLSVKQSNSQNYEFYLSSLVRQSNRVAGAQPSCEARLQHVCSSLFQFDSMVHDDATGAVMNAKNATVRLLHRFAKIPTSEASCRYQLNRLLKGHKMEYLPTAPVALILGVQRPRTTKYCSSVMGSVAAPLPVKKNARSVMHKVSLFFSKRFHESDMYHLLPVEQNELLRNITRMSQIHCILDNFEAALCMFIRASGASRTHLSEDTCRECLSALEAVLSFARGPYIERTEVGQELSAFRALQERVSNQQLCAKLGIVDRLFCILRIPRQLGDTWTRCILRNSSLSKISSLIIFNLYHIAQSNDVVQRFISKSKYNLSRQIDVEQLKTSSSTEDINRPSLDKDVGYLPSLLDYLLSVRAADSIAFVAAGIIFENRTLSRMVVTKELVHFIASILSKYGPSEKLIGLFSAMIVGSRKHISKNQSMILEVVCSTSNDPIFIDTRSSIMIETQLFDGHVYVSWCGSEQYIRGKSIDAELFYDAKTLGLQAIKIPPPPEFQRYLARRKASQFVSDSEWTKLAEFAWAVDPKNCYQFWKSNPYLAWQKYLSNVPDSTTIGQEFRENVDNLRSICQHYLGVIELYTNLCINSIQCMRHVENQFTYPLCIRVLRDKRIPLIFKRNYLRLISALYVDRFPNVTQLCPNYARCQNNLDSAEDLVGAVVATNFVFDVSDTSIATAHSMHEKVDVLFGGHDQDRESTKIPYVDFLKKHHSIVVSTDLDKYSELQKIISDHFVSLSAQWANQNEVPLTKKQLFIQQEHRHLGGSSYAISKFNIEALKLLQNLLNYGFYSSKDQLLEAAKICFAAIAYHGKLLQSSALKEDDGSTSDILSASTDYSRSLDEDSFESHVGYESLVQNEIAHRDETHDWEYFARLEDPDGADDIPSRSSFPSLGALERKGWSGSRSSTEPNHSSAESRRGLYITRLCMRHDQQQKVTLVREFIWQNQRWSGINWLPESFLNPVGTYSSPNSLLSQRFSFFNSIEDARNDAGGLPNNYAWVWAEDWTIQHVLSINGDDTRSNDNGWFYAVNWPHQFHPEPLPLHFVRKRLWERDRRLKSAVEFVDGVMDGGYSKDDVYRALSKPGNISRDGVMDFDKIYTSLNDEDSKTMTPFDVDQNAVALRSHDSTTLFQDFERNAVLCSKALSKSCEILLNIVQIVLDSRVTYFFRVASTLPPPSEKRHQQASHYWKMSSRLNSAGEQVNFVQFTRRGEAWFRGIFTDFKLMDKTILGSESMLHFNKSIFTLLMEQSHELCDSTLTYLRNFYGQVSMLVDSLHKTVLIRNPEVVERYNAMRAIMMCIDEDGREWVHAFPAPPEGLSQSLLLNLSKLRRALCVVSNEEQDAGATEINNCEISLTMQRLMRVNNGHFAIVKLFKYCVRTSESKTVCGVNCRVFEAVADVVDAFCQENMENKLAIMPLIIPLILEFEDSNKTCSCCYCDSDAVLQVVVSVFSDFDVKDLPMKLETFVHLLVSYTNLDTAKAFTMFKVLQILRSLVKPGNAHHEKHAHDVIMKIFFQRENKNKLLFFELNSSRSDALVKMNRTSLIIEYSSSFSLDVTIHPSRSLGALLVCDVQLLYHAGIVEIFAYCFDDCVDSNYLRCLSFETVVSVLQTVEAFNCPPLVYAYGLFLYRVFLRGNGSEDYVTKIVVENNSTIDISNDARLYDALSKLCAAATDPESLKNSHRLLIFDIVLPCLRSFLLQTLFLSRQRDHFINDTLLDSLVKLTQHLLSHLVSHRRSLSSKELALVCDVWQELNFPMDDDLSSSIREASEYKEATEIDTADNGDIELSDAINAPSEEATDPKKYIKSLLDNCPILEKMKAEEFQHFVDFALECFLHSTEPSAQETFFHFIKRMVHYCREVISCISSNQNREFLLDFVKKTSNLDVIMNDSISNVEMILELMTNLLLKESINGVNMRSVMNKNAAGELIIDIVSLEQNRNHSLLFESALRCGIELLYGGRNASCQQILFDYLSVQNHANRFFKSIEWYIEHCRCHDVILESDVDFNLTQVLYLLHFLQLLCEGHFLKMQNLIFSRGSFFEGCVDLFQRLVHKNTSNAFILIDSLVLIRLLDFFVEIVQGPCLRNQLLLLKHEGLMTAMSMILEYDMPSSSFRWEEVPRQCLKFEARQNARSSLRRAAVSSKLLRFINFAELKGMKNRVLLLQNSLLEGRLLRPSDAANFMTSLLSKSDARKKLESVQNEYKTVSKVLSKSSVSLLNDPSSYMDTSYQEKCQVVLSFIREEGFLVLSLYDLLIDIQPSIVTDKILPESVSAKHSSKPHHFRMEHHRHTERYKATYSSYRAWLRKVEVHWVGRGLFQYSFVKPRLCNFLTRDTKREIKDRIDLNSDSKVISFLGELRVASVAMTLQMRLRDKSLSFLLWFQNEISAFLVVLAFLINFLLMMSLEKGYFSDKESPQFSSSTFEQHARWLVFFQFLIECFSTLQALILRLPLVVQEWQHNFEDLLAKHPVKITKARKLYIAFQHFSPTIQLALGAVVVNLVVQLRYLALVSVVVCALAFCRSLYFYFQEPFKIKRISSRVYLIIVQVLSAGKTRNRIVFTIFSILCLDLSRPYWNSVMLLQMVENSKTLQNVIRAITLPAYSLLQSCVLGLICIFIFAVFGFFFFPDSFYNEDQGVDECHNLLFCYATFLHRGLLNGGGIADHINGDLGHDPVYTSDALFTSRVSYDIVFFVFISVLLLNIIFGIIIDTFGNLREIQAEELRLQTSFCFICGLPKEAFDTRANNAIGATVQQLNFKGHVMREHNMWDYLFFLIYLKEKPRCNHTGLESYVADMVDRDDFSWIPAGIACGVSNVDENFESKKSFDASLQEVSSNMQSTVESLVKNETRELHSSLQNLAKDVILLKSTIETLVESSNA